MREVVTEGNGERSGPWITRRGWLLFTSAAGLTTLMAACQAAAPPSPTSPSQPSAANQAPAAVTAPQPGATDVFKIAAHGDRSQGSAFVTKIQLEAVELAVSEINNSGGINGARVDFSFEDEANNPAVAAQKAQKFVADGAHMILSLSSSATGLQAQKVAEESQIPIASPTNTATELTVPPRKWYFRTAMRADYAAQAFVDFAKDVFSSKVAVVREGSETGLLISDAMLKGLSSASISPLTVEQINPGQTDASAIANKVKSSGAQGLLLVGGSDIGLMATYVKAHVTAGNKIPIFGSNTLSIATFDTLTKGYNDGILFQDSADPTRPEYQAVADKFKAKNGPNFDVNVTHVQAYEFLRLAFDAMKRAGSPDRAKIRDALEATANFPVAMGPKGAFVTFGPEDHDMWKNTDYVLVRKFVGGTFGPAIWSGKDKLFGDLPQL